MKGNRRRLVRMIYLSVLSRHPTEAEMETIVRYYRTKGVSSYHAGMDLVWALVNSKEFLYRH